MGRHRGVGILAAIGITLAASVATTLPGAAGANCTGTAETAPDAFLKRSNAEGAIGKDVFPLSVISGEPLLEGQERTYKIKWKNLDGAPRTIRVTSELLLDQGRKAKYFVGDIRVTDRLFERSLKFADVPPGGKATLTLVVLNKAALAHVAEFRGRYGQAPLATCDEIFISVND